MTLEATMAAAVGLVAVQGLFVWWLARFVSADRARRKDEQRERQVRESIYNLYTLANTMAENVVEHQQEVDQISKELTDLHPEVSGELASVVLGFAAQIVQANQKLQRRLNRTEQRLQTQASQIEAHMVEARTDALTRLPNRRSFDESLARYLAQFRRGGPGFSLMLLDVDHFKSLNDQLGHVGGDAVLTDLARGLLATTRDADILCRYGGEEFAVVLPNTGLAGAQQAAERFRKAVERRAIHVQDRELSVTISVGVAEVAHGEEMIALMQRADRALYAAKNAGRNCSYYHDGQQCLPIGDLPGEAAAAGPPLVESRTQQVDARWLAIQANLQSRLAELEQTPQSAALG